MIKNDQRVAYEAANWYEETFGLNGEHIDAVDRFLDLIQLLEENMEESDKSIEDTPLLELWSELDASSGELDALEYGLMQTGQL